MTTKNAPDATRADVKALRKEMRTEIRELKKRVNGLEKSVGKRTTKRPRNSVLSSDDVVMDS